MTTFLPAAVTGQPVLIVEDSDEDFDTASEAARKAGLTNELRRAHSGDACLRMLRGEGESPLRPAFVLMDLNTPGTDGREALREIRADEHLGELPVVVFSTSGNPKDLEFCYRAGANAYHVKPVRYTDHLDVLRTIFDYWLGCAVLPQAEEIIP